MTALTTTSHAILGLLTLRPHSAYDLTQQARRSLAFVWPVSESQLYAEPQRLAREGYVRAAEEPAGTTRIRTVYRITPKGRRALKNWLASPLPAPALGSEMLLRVAFADAGDKASLLESFESCRVAVNAQYDAGRGQIQEHLAGEAPYLERASLNTLWWVLVGEQLRLTLQWLDWATAHVRSWDGTEPRGFDARLRTYAEQLVNGEPILPAFRATSSSPGRP